MKTNSIRVVFAAVLAGAASFPTAADQTRVTMFGVLEQNVSNGALSVGGQEVSLPQIVPSGSMVRVSGVIAPNGTLRGDQVVVLHRAQLAAAPTSFASPVVGMPQFVQATSIRTAGVTDTNIEGVTGTNIEGVTGTNIEGVTGTNIEGVTGTNIEGVTGTNTAGVTATNVF